jgi:leucine-rich PPR motif-containing protein
MHHISRVGLGPNSVTFDCIIDGYGNLGDGLKAFSLLDEMIRLGHHPSPFTYGSLLKGYARGAIWRRQNSF